MENSTPCKIVTPENFILKLGTYDYVENVTYYTIFDVDRFNADFSQNRWNITLLWFFSCLVLSFLASSNAQLETRGRFSRIMAHMTCFRPRTVHFGVTMITDIIWANVPPKTRQKGERIGVFKPNAQNTKTCVLSKLLHRFQPNFRSDKDR